MADTELSKVKVAREHLELQPILHPPAMEPDRHWKTEAGKTHNVIVNRRRLASEPIPTGKASTEIQSSLDFPTHDGDVCNEGQGILECLRGLLRAWREDGYPGTTTATRKFLTHLAAGVERESKFNLFFAQREALETVVYLTECSPSTEKMRKRLFDLADEFNDGLVRLALRMATGTGKTAVMACLIAWYAINSRSSRNLGGAKNALARNISRVIVVCPGKTVSERLKVLDPRGKDNIYNSWQLLPKDLRPKLNQIKVDVVNFEKLQPRENADRADLKVAGGQKGMSVTGINTVLGREKGHARETIDQMWSRLLKLNSGMSEERTVVLNDEGHHCWNRKVDKKPGLWMEALKSLRSHPVVKLAHVIDLTATPYFIDPAATHGYCSKKDNDPLFPWIVSEYALAESMESGLVKIPRIPTGRSEAESVRLRNLYETTNGKPLKVGSQALRQVREAAQLLYEDYKETFDRWKAVNDPRLGEPVFIVVVNTKQNAEVLFEMLSGYQNEEKQFCAPDGFDLLANVPKSGCQFEDCVMRSIMVVSRGSPERNEGGYDVQGKSSRLGIRKQLSTSPDDDEVQEVLQTVGQPGKKGSSVRCVVSVGMLTEGWDCQRVTHILGYRKFGSQLLCEQVLGRALRRQDYDNRITARRTDTGITNERYPAEYATVIGVPFQTRVDGRVKGGDPPPAMTEVFPVEERADKFAIWVPVIDDYRLVVPDDEMELDLDRIDESILGRPEDYPVPIGGIEVQGWMGDPKDISINFPNRFGYGVWKIAAEICRNLQLRIDKDNEQSVSMRSSTLFTDCLKIARRWSMSELAVGWSNTLLVSNPGAMQSVVDALLPAISAKQFSEEAIRLGVAIDPKQPLYSASKWKGFTTRLKDIAVLKHSELNVAACHSKLESIVAKKLDSSELVAAITRNHGPERIEVPYRDRGEAAIYVPDFFLRLRGNGEFVPHVVLEVKGVPDDSSERKKAWTKEWWIPAANEFGRERNQKWCFVEVGPHDDPIEVMENELKEMET